MKTISGFRGEYKFLSNFYPAVIYYEEIIFPSVEHAYQAAKFGNLADRFVIAQLTPGQAKRKGREACLPWWWEEQKVDVMRHLLFVKFADPAFCKMLLKTGDAELIEDNNWSDTFWGQWKGVGQNKLGTLLMEVRTHYAVEQSFENP